MALEKMLEVGMDEQSLRIVLEVARQGSLTKAAESLHISPQGLKKRIDSIESELDCSLFIRSATGCVPTPKGRTFVELAPHLLDEMDSFIGKVKWGATALRIAFWPNRGNRLQDDINFRFQQKYPGVEILFVAVDSLGLASKLSKGDIDVAFVTEETANLLGEFDFSVCPGILQYYAAIVKAESPLARCDGPIDLGRLAETPLACVGEHVFAPYFIDESNVQFISEDKHAVASFCNSGGACICEEFYEVDYPGLIVKPIEVEPSRIGCLYRPNPSPTVRRYLSIATQHVK